MKKINHIKDLPEWFDLNNYSGTEKFDAADWYKHLIYRKEMFDLAPYLAEINCHELSPFKLSMINGQMAKLEKMLQTPLHTHGDRYYIPIISPEKIPVKPLHFLHLREQFHNDTKAMIDGRASQFAVERWLYLEASSHQLGSNRALLETPILLTKYDGSEHETHALSVDLRTTDAVLVNAFTKWLKDTRKQQAASSKRDRPAYNNWTRYGILPYLDLLIWSKITKTHIPRRIYSAAVSNNDPGESTFNKTIVGIANKLMKDLSELQSLAQDETFGSNHDPECFIQENFQE